MCLCQIQQKEENNLQHLRLWHLPVSHKWKNEAYEGWLRNLGITGYKVNKTFGLGQTKNTTTIKRAFLGLKSFTDEIKVEEHKNKSQLAIN